MTQKQVDKLTQMLDEAFSYADKYEIFVTINCDGVEIEGRYAVQLPRAYVVVGSDE